MEYYNLYKTHCTRMATMNHERFLRGLKARLWATAREILQPGTTIEAVIKHLYHAEKRGYHRGYKAREIHERRMASGGGIVRSERGVPLEYAVNPDSVD